MAQDDMQVIIYRILKYLYGCMKKGEEPDPEALSADGPLMHVPESYRQAVFEELADRGLVKGVGIRRYFGGYDVDIENPRITLDGVEFLEENSAMRKVANFLKETKDIIPGL